VALYVPAGRRRRNIILGLVGAVIVGLIIGAVLGRVTAPTIDDKVSSVQDTVRAVTARIRATPIEYEKQLNGSTEFRGGGTVAQSLSDAQQSLNGALDDAVWMGGSQRNEIKGSMAALLATAKSKTSAARYEKLAEETAAALESSFGISG
jgi:hypothetical protein